MCVEYVCVHTQKCNIFPKNVKWKKNVFLCPVVKWPMDCYQSEAKGLWTTVYYVYYFL